MIAFSKFHHFRTVESTDYFSAGNKSKSLDTFEVGVLDSHDVSIGKQLLRVIINQLSIDKDVAAVLYDLVNFILD